MRRFIFGGAMAVGLVSTSGLAQSTATYTGINNGNWNAPGNWNLGVVPINGGGLLYNAIVPVNVTVNFDLDGARELSGLNLQSGSLLNIGLGSQLRVTGVSVTSGMVRATGGGTLFQANSAFASMQANSRAAAADGATVRLGGISYNCSGYYGDILSASGAGTLLDMSTFGSITAPWNGGCCSYRDQYVRASDGGVIDLSSLTTVVGAAYNGWLRFREETGGKILLPNLVSSSGYVIYEPTSALFRLPSLQSATTGYFIVLSGNQIDLPMVSSLGSCTISTGGNGASFTAPFLNSCTSTSIAIADGGAFVAPNLKTFDYSAVDLNPMRTFTTPLFSSIHGAQLRIFGGKHFAVAATDYSTGSALGDILVADGNSSVLDVSNIKSLRTPYNGGCCSYGENRIRASAGGLVNLSGVKTMEGVSYNGWLRVRAENGGNINLGSLQSVTNAVYFEAFGSNLAMPLLQSASSSSFNVGVFDTIAMGSLTEAHGCSFNIADGATVLAPSLTNFDNSYIELTPSRFFEAPPFTNISNSRIFLKEGATLVVDAPQYANGGAPGDALLADGFGTKLDLSSLQTFQAGWNGGCCSYGEVRVRASNGGTIDLSGLTTVGGAVYNGVTRFDAASGGRLIFGSPVFSSGFSRISADGIFSNLYFNSASLRAATQLILTLVSNVHFTGSFDFDSVDENAVQLGNGKVFMDGSATAASPQRLEVGGADIGLPVGAIAQNFQIGQLTIGKASRATNVLLVDAIDNGNRTSGQKERLYLQGFPSESGLRILGGSTLYLGGIDLYAVIGNNWVNIRSLFGPGQECVIFDGGRICLNQAPPCPGDLNGDSQVDDSDFLIFVPAYNILDCADPAMPLGCPADLNGDFVVDDSDFTPFVQAYDELLCP